MRAACYRRLTFDPEWRNGGSSANVDAKEGDTDEDDDTPAIATANGVYAYNCDWNDIEKSERPTRAAAMLLHRARQRTGTSRWWLCDGRLMRCRCWAEPATLTLERRTSSCGSCVSSLSRT
jgi:hypothetical protein